MTREAAIEDIPMLVDVIREFHSASPFWSRWPYEPDAIEDLCSRIISADEGLLLIGDRGGFGMFVIAPVPFSKVLKTCLEIGLYGKGDVLSILRFAEDWAKDSGAHVLPTAAHAGMRSAGKVYAHRGYQELETLYAKVL